MRDWYRGCASAFQAEETSSNLVSRSSFRRPYGRLFRGDAAEMAGPHRTVNPDP
jgi:hypothetical protein